MISGENFREIIERGSDCVRLSHATEEKIFNCNPPSSLINSRRVIGAYCLREIGAFETKVDALSLFLVDTRCFFADLIRFESFI